MNSRLMLKDVSYIRVSEEKGEGKGKGKGMLSDSIPKVSRRRYLMFEERR